MWPESSHFRCVRFRARSLACVETLVPLAGPIRAFAGSPPARRKGAVSTTGSRAPANLRSVHHSWPCWLPGMGTPRKRGRPQLAAPCRRSKVCSASAPSPQCQHPCPSWPCHLLPLAISLRCRGRSTPELCRYQPPTQAGPRCVQPKRTHASATSRPAPHCGAAAPDAMPVRWHHLWRWTTGTCGADSPS